MRHAAIPKGGWADAVAGANEDDGTAGVRGLCGAGGGQYRGAVPALRHQSQDRLQVVGAGGWGGTVDRSLAPSLHLAWAHLVGGGGARAASARLPPLRTRGAE